MDVSELAGYLERCRFPRPGSEVVCAVSGGTDSTALLVLALAAGCQVSVIHVNHGLRDDADADAAFVRGLCEDRDVPCRVVAVDVPGGPNLEERARRARYSVLPADAMLAHTADDQAETVLLNLMRGAGPVGLAGMPADARRPMLGLRRADAADVCRSAGIDPRHDEMNVDRSFRRVRVREELRPLLDDIAQRDTVPVLARTAALFSEISDLIETLHRDIDPVDVAQLRDLHPVVARAALRDWIRSETGDDHPVDAAALERAMRVAHGAVTATELPGGWRLKRSIGRLSIASAGESLP